MDFYRPPTTQGALNALGTIFRAVRAWKFYPKGHPTRRNSLITAHAAMLKMLDGNTLSLSCGRNCFSFPDGEQLKDATKQTCALSFELLIRRVQKITFAGDLFQEDLLELVKILCMSPEDIQQSGGVDTIMTTHGVRSISVNEFDLTAISGKRQQIEQAGIVPEGVDEVENGTDTPPVVDQTEPEPDALLPDQQLQKLLERLATCVDDDNYLILIRLAASCADSLLARHEAHLLLPLVELLASHTSDETRSETMREGAQFAIEQIITTDEVIQIVLERAGQDEGVSQKALFTVIKVGGATAITAAIELMGRTNSLKVRKILSTMLGSLGEAAVPALLEMMNDSRWFIIRNICAILGAIADREALPALSTCLYHADLRVRKEAIRSLAQIGGNDAETAILGILRGSDTELYPQAIASLGGMKSRRALSDLMKIVFARDMFLKSLSLKIDALAAIALIGDHQVTPHLVRLLEEHYLFTPARGKQLKTAVVVCLGKLGDTRALPALEKLASGGGELGSACLDAISQLEKTEERADEIS
ncbi:MAG: HEAT repeat domain-containing protein [Desulfuromonadaceae bacterium]|nr:HEAT repeat domain-containing protein [Desulfuromonadaceae bacterium]MDD2849422.1 HEAT repeat domain-containing protein [Desulfuromonadaceae bacterium]MDD4130010.1 HEAT repeat domain-containing protein [Desulfuromonadaceae bacterium]